MSHDLFISYSNKDKLVADAVCHQAEAAGIRCWIAPRDIPQGAMWAGAITRAIRGCRILLLIFTDESNRSKEVVKEVGIAAHAGKDIINFRVSDAEANDDLCYHLLNRHWLDAITPPLELHIGSLVARLRLLLGMDEEEQEECEHTSYDVLCPWCALELRVPGDAKVECTGCNCEFWYSVTDDEIYWEEVPITVVCPKCEDEADGVILVQESKAYQCPSCGLYTEFERAGDEALHDEPADRAAREDEQSQARGEELAPGFLRVLFDSSVADPDFAGWGPCGSDEASIDNIRRINFLNPEGVEGLAVELRANGSEWIGLNRVFHATKGRLIIQYRADESSAEVLNLICFVIPLRREPGGSLLEFGATSPLDPDNAYLPYRARYFVPAPHVGDGRWHDAEIPFDFQNLPEVTRCVVALRVNEGCPRRGSGTLTIGRVIVYRNES